MTKPRSLIVPSHGRSIEISASLGKPYDSDAERRLRTYTRTPFSIGFARACDYSPAMLGCAKRSSFGKTDHEDFVPRHERRFSRMGSRFIKCLICPCRHANRDSQSSLTSDVKMVCTCWLVGAQVLLLRLFRINLTGVPDPINAKGNAEGEARCGNSSSCFFEMLQQNEGIGDRHNRASKIFGAYTPSLPVLGRLQVYFPTSTCGKQKQTLFSHVVAEIDSMHRVYDIPFDIFTKFIFARSSLP